MEAKAQKEVDQVFGGMRIQDDDTRRRRVVDESFDVLKEQFVDDEFIDWKVIQRRLLRRVKKMRNDKDLENILQWLYQRVGDPFTRYLTEDQLKAMKGDIDGEMCGVGIVFNAEQHGWLIQGKRVVIKHVVPGSPADEAGLECSDRITAIDMTDVRGLTFDEVTTSLLGKAGHKVLLTFQKKNDSAELSVLLERRRFQVPTVTAELIGDDVCYVQIREFAMNTAKQMRECLRETMKQREQRRLLASPKMKFDGGIDISSDWGYEHDENEGMRLLILDLRGNSGGLVDKSIEVARMFLDRDDTVVKFIGQSGKMSVETGRDNRLWWFWCWWRSKWSSSPVSMISRPLTQVMSSSFLSALPIWRGLWRNDVSGMNQISQYYQRMVILVDGETASASELLASALRDNCKAVIVGTPTFGKGSVQAIVPLSNGGGAVVTVARYLTPRNNAIGVGNGVRPDRVMFQLPSDPQLVVERLVGKKARGWPMRDRVMGERKLKWIKHKVNQCLVRRAANQCSAMDE